MPFMFLCLSKIIVFVYKDFYPLSCHPRPFIAILFSEIGGALVNLEHTQHTTPYCFSCAKKPGEKIDPAHTDNDVNIFQCLEVQCFKWNLWDHSDNQACKGENMSQGKTLSGSTGWRWWRASALHRTVVPKGGLFIYGCDTGRSMVFLHEVLKTWNSRRWMEHPFLGQVDGSSSWGVFRERGQNQ